MVTDARAVTGRPWTIYDRSDDLHIKIKGQHPKTGGAHIATVLGEANARLIAAAPDLLDAILYSDDAHWTPAMRAAMLKATGYE
jgi:hypothetical protein